MKRLVGLGVLGLSLVAGHVGAQVFRGVVQDNTGVTGTGTFSVESVQEAVDRLDNDRLPNILPGYVNTDNLVADVDFRGLPMSFVYPAGSPSLNFSVPEIDFSMTFDGATRDESNRLLADFLENNSDFLRRLGKALVAKSPADPLAGNPLSLQSTMIGGDFAAAFAAVSPFSDEEEDEGKPRSSLQPYMVAQAGGALPALRGATAVGGLAGGGFNGSSLSFQEIRANGLSLPLQYNARSDIDPRRGFSFRLPLSISSYEGSVAGGANLAFAYRYPINRRWIIVPSAGYGLTASTDLGSVGSMVSTSVASAAGIKFNRFDLVVANMVGYYRSIAAPGGNYSYDPGIANVAFKNGIMLARPVPIFGAQRGAQLYLFDTRTTGSALFVEDWQEIGVTLASRPRVNLARDYGSVSLGYLHSSKYKGLTVQLSYLF